jgi:uncharacterized protein YejL (UPF0352 family)
MVEERDARHELKIIVVGKNQSNLLTRDIA